MLRFVVVLALTFGLSSVAVAGEQDHTCQGGHNCNEGGGVVENTSESNSTASVINSVPVTVNVETPSGGFTPAVIADDTQVGVEVNNNAEAPDMGDIVATPSTIYTNLCTNGAGGSGSGWTASVGSGSRFCKHVKLAEMALAQGDAVKHDRHIADAEGLLFRNSFVCKWFGLDFIPLVNSVLCSG